jgi:hypothetical protein
MFGQNLGHKVQIDKSVETIISAQISWKLARKVVMQIEYGSSGVQYETL